MDACRASEPGRSVGAGARSPAELIWEPSNRRILDIGSWDAGHHGFASKIQDPRPSIEEVGRDPHETWRKRIASPFDVTRGGLSERSESKAGPVAQGESARLACGRSRVQFPPGPPCTTRFARAHGGATGVLDRVVRALNPSAARGSGWRYQPGWYHGDRFRPQRTEAAVFCNERRLL